MNKIVEYQLARMDKVTINDLLKDGWQPYGNPFPANETVYQPMVKYEEPKPPAKPKSKKG